MVSSFLERSRHSGEKPSTYYSLTVCSLNSDDKDVYNDKYNENKYFCMWFRSLYSLNRVKAQIIQQNFNQLGRSNQQSKIIGSVLVIVGHIIKNTLNMSRLDSSTKLV